MLSAAAMALIWANSPWHGSYDRLWSTDLSISLGRIDVALDLRHWVNEGLMTIFFLIAGLEIKREFVSGELSHPRAAILPVIAALGGMVVPALLYLAINTSGEGSRGWGIPMATDIAFALGVLGIAARRAPSGLTSFLLTLAIVDDIGAILVIALFYSSGLDPVALAAAVVLVVVIVGLQRIRVRAAAVYIALGTGVWFAVLESGIDPAIAGVVLGLLTPAVPFQRPRTVSAEAHRIADETVDDPEPVDADAPAWLYLTEISREAVSPLARVEHVLHPWSSFVIVPLFALANAGVRLGGGDLFSPIGIGIVVGLVVGKPLGIGLATAGAVASGLGRLPAGVTQGLVVGAGAVAGIGFTVSLLIAGLAFTGGADLTAAKIGVLGASLLASVVGAVILKGAMPRVSGESV